MPNFSESKFDGWISMRGRALRTEVIVAVVAQLFEGARSSSALRMAVKVRCQAVVVARPTLRAYVRKLSDAPLPHTYGWLTIVGAPAKWMETTFKCGCEEQRARLTQ
jgi:hypothetical protein